MSLGNRQHNFGSDLALDYRHAFQKHSWGNTLFADATFHLLLGQLPHIRDLNIRKGSVNSLDPRVHVCYLSPSATGKGVGASFVGTMAERLDLKYQEADEFTDAALVGTIDSSGDGDPEPEYGWLHPRWGINILSMTEATMVFEEQGGEYRQNLMNHLQKSMNPMGTSDNQLSKKLAQGEPIEFNPRVSLFMTTYVPTNLEEIVLERGLLQRMLLLTNRATNQDRREMSQRSLKAMQNPPDTTEQEEDIAERLLAIDQHYRNIDDLTLTPQAVERFGKSNTRLYDMIAQTGPYYRERLGEFVTRFENHRTKLSMHFACLNKHEEITRQDAHRASIRTRFFFKNIVAYLEDAIEVPREFDERLSQMKQIVKKAFKKARESSDNGRRGDRKKPRGCPIRDVVETAQDVANITGVTAEHYVESLIDYGLLQRNPDDDDYVFPSD